MPTKRLFVPDDILRPAQSGEDKNIRLLKYVNSITQENFDSFLTHHSLIFILSGVKQIKVGSNQFDIRAGELFLIPKGEYVMSEYITGEHGFRSLMLFFCKRVVQGLAEQLNGCLPECIPERIPAKIEAVKIIPHNREIEKLFSSLEEYSKSKSPFMCELIRLKFTELVYLLLDAARSDNPALSAVLDRHLYSLTTVNELAMLSGRSLSSFKREFAQEYGEAPRGWIRRKKLEHAAYLLDTSDQTIEEVTDASGFVSAAHFARLFKEQYQMTPTEYRGRNDERWPRSKE